MHIKLPPPRNSVNVILEPVFTNTNTPPNKNPSQHPNYPGPPYPKYLPTALPFPPFGSIIRRLTSTPILLANSTTSSDEIPVH